MSSQTNIYYVGPTADAAERLARELSVEVQSSEFPAQAKTGDVVFLAARCDTPIAAGLPGGNAFSACRTLKNNPQIRVFLVLEGEDPFAPEIARFCLADGCIQDDGQSFTGLEAVRARMVVESKRASVDEMLASLEREIASDEGKKHSAIQRMMAEQRHDWVLEHLADPATGLFCGPFASFKLEEEFKRATRFHQPLSLILLDLAEESLPTDPGSRDSCLAEAASVFLTASRDIDVLARFTETTFLMLLPGTGSAGATSVARRMLDELRERRFHGDAELSPAAGLATIPDSGIADRHAFLARAEACLRLARQGQDSDGLCVSCE